MRRSGNHALVNWIRQQSPGGSVFYNNLKPLGEHWQGPPKPDVANKTAPGRILVHSYEDTKLNYVAGRHFNAWRRDHLPAADQSLNILILRDPFNLMASRLQSEASGKYPMMTGREGATNLWIMYAREFLRDTQYIDTPVCVSYNHWCVDADYRRQLTKQLELPFTDAGRAPINAAVGDSSFDAGAAAGTSPLDRWKLYAEDPNYIGLFKNPVVLDFAERIFQLDDDLMAFVHAVLRPRTSRLYGVCQALAFRCYRRIAAVRLEAKIFLKK